MSLPLPPQTLLNHAAAQTAVPLLASLSRGKYATALRGVVGFPDSFVADSAAKLMLRAPWFSDPAYSCISKRSVNVERDAVPTWPLPPGVLCGCHNACTLYGCQGVPKGECACTANCGKTSPHRGRNLRSFFPAHIIRITNRVCRSEIRLRCRR